MLEKLKAASTLQQMSIKTNSEAETLLIITPCLRIGGENFEEFRIVFFPQYMFKENEGEYRFSFDKKDLQDYKDVMLDQHGLAHYNQEKNRSDLMLLITAADDNSYQRKLKALKAYLGIGGAENTPPKTGSYTVSLEQIQEIFAVKGKQLENLKAVLPYLNSYMADWGITDNNRLAYLLSQLGPETGNFRNFDEKDDGKYSKVGMVTTFGKRLDKCKNSVEDMVKDPNNPEELFNCVYCCDNENGNESSGDGFRYRGRGLIQLTHKESYRKFTLWYNKNYADDPQDFVENPDLLVQPKYATLSALWEFCVDKNYDEKIFNSIEREDVDNITRAINGKNALPETLNSRQNALKNIKKKLDN